MDHPLRRSLHKDLRKRVVDFIKNGYLAPRQSNIIFVCGGNNPDNMRKRFQVEFPNILPDFEFFEPEFAMRNYFSSPASEPFDITDFEKLVGELSHAIVIFPEAPGSFAETGYFAAIPSLASKIILAIDESRQKLDSFIALGPAKKIQDASIINPNINISYSTPDFELISKRIITRAPLSPTLKSMCLGKFLNLSVYDLFCLIHKVVSLMSITTNEDIEFMLRALFKSQISVPSIKKIISVLVGSNSLVEVGRFGHLTRSNPTKEFWQIREGLKTTENALRLEISALYPTAEPDFITVMRAAGHVS